MKKILLVITLMLSSCNNRPDPCHDSVSVISDSWLSEQHYRCEHPDHVMTTEKIGTFTGGVKVMCTCPKSEKK